MRTMLLLLTLISFTAKSQCIYLSARTSGNLLHLQINYTGIPLPTQAISMKVSYDTNVFQYDSIRSNNSFINSGYYASSPKGLKYFAIRWFAESNDTAYLKTGALFDVWLHKNNTGCSPFNFSAWQPEDHEICDMNYQPYDITWANCVICNLGSYVQKPYSVDVLGREITIKNNKKYMKR